MNPAKDGTSSTKSINSRALRVARELMELPLARFVAKPLYKQYFKRPYYQGNLYLGIYSDYDQALQQACRLSSSVIPPTYDVEAAAILYQSQLNSIRACDYPTMHWIQTILHEGARRIFDLGGHLGLAYYGFERYLDYPPGLSWTVHDLPGVTVAGRALANRRDTFGRLHFSDSPLAVDGADILVSTGALQYLDYSLPELLDRLSEPPGHVLINLTPMHESKSFFTVQNLGIAICPYRVYAKPDLIEQMRQRGYQLWDLWRLEDRHLRVPFEPAYDVQYYHGLYFRHEQEDRLRVRGQRVRREVTRQISPSVSA